jgi:hypothetical protein
MAGPLFAELMGGNLGIGMGIGVAEPADELVLAPVLPFFLLVFHPFPPFFFGGMVVNLFYTSLFRLCGLLPLLSMSISMASRTCRM